MVLAKFGGDESRIATFYGAYEFREAAALALSCFCQLTRWLSAAIEFLTKLLDAGYRRRSCRARKRSGLGLHSYYDLGLLFATSQS